MKHSVNLHNNGDIFPKYKEFKFLISLDCNWPILELEFFKFQI